MIYNETTKELYIDRQEIINPKNADENNTDKPDTHLAKPKQEI